MIEQATGRPTGCRRAGRYRRQAGLAALGLILLAGLSAWAGAIGGAPAFAAGEASGEGGGAPGGTQSSPTGSSSCPSPNPPNQLTLVAGTPQTTTLDTAFAGLQVALSNSDGCAVTGAAGIPVTFSAPTGGASGRFSSSNAETATVGADASGAVAAPTFTANGAAGSYTVTASSPYGSVSFSLTNTAGGVWCSTLDSRVSTSAGEPAKLTAGVGSTQSALAGTPFPIRLAVTVTDAQKNPVPGALVTFSAPLVGASGRFTIHSRGLHHRTRVSHPRTVKVKSGACGIAVAPAFTANQTQGGYIVEATVEHARPVAFALVNEAPGQAL
jgi:hypothetical protein